MNDCKVLVFCPTYQDKMRPETVQSLERLIIPPGVAADIHVSRENPYGHNGDGYHDHENTLYQYQLAERMTLDGGYDALLTVEHDMIIPPDGFVKLWETDAPVVYGVYAFRTKHREINAFRLSRGNWVDSSLSLYQDDLRKAVEKKIVDVSGCGFGFTLIRRVVFDNIHIRRPENGTHPAPDVQFAVDCMRAGLRQVARFDVICGHWHNGQVLYPDITEDGMNVKIFVLRDVNVSVGGRTVRLLAGREAEIDLEVVDDLARAGYIRVMDQPPAVKIVHPPEQKRKSVK